MGRTVLTQHLRARTGFATTGSALAIGLSLAVTPAYAQTAEQPIQPAQPSQSGLPSGQSSTDAVSSDEAVARNATDPTAPGDASDEVVVTGIRASLASAAGRKRNSAIVQDSITQEDLGKFPDANVAESLQRIPGVSIDRSNGEGQFVTVRGLGPQFNTVLVNGRSFASDNYGREFSFDLLAAELISGADVYKTSQARIQDGGIGSTINLRTSRPLDLDGLRVIGTAKANYEPNSKKTTPQLFALVSDTFADDTVGILGSISYQKRIAQVNSATSDGWLPNVDVGPSSAPFFTDIYAPRNVSINSSRDRRTRLGATLVGQYRPSDALLLTVDGLYNHFKSEATTNGLGLWFEPSAYTAATIDENRSVTSLTTSSNADMINNSGIRDTTTYEAGFNADWNPTDQLHVVFDATTSHAKNDGAGRSFFNVAGIPTDFSFVANEPGGLPTFSGFTADLTDVSLLRNHLAQRNGNTVAERVNEFKLDTEWKSDAGALKVVRLGVSYTSRARRNQAASTLNADCLYCGYTVPSDGSQYGARPFTVGHIGNSGSLPMSYIRYDPNAYLDYLASPATLALRDQVLGLAPGTSAADLAAQSDGNGFDAVLDPPDRVKEQVYAGYAEVDFEGELGGFEWFVNVGARYLHTQVRSASQSRALLDLVPVPNDPSVYDGVYANNGEFVAVSASSNYDKFLPDLNARIKLAPNVNFRLGASKTLTRPTLNDLRPVTSYDTLRPAVLAASGGNVNLKPYEATNFDASLEWYPTSTTTLSVAGFYKNIKDFIVTTIENETLTIANSQNIPVGGFITGQNEATFATARPRNAGSANVRGVELNAVATFDFLPGVLSGFGTSLNATFVSTNRTFQNVTPEERFAVVGLGNSQNATLFYEKFGISARIAYNRRERFLSSIANGYGSEPLFVRTYGQFDASAAFDINRHVQIFAEGTNIFNAKYVTEARFSNQLRGYYNYGARFDGGVRVKF